MVVSPYQIKTPLSVGTASSGTNVIQIMSNQDGHFSYTNPGLQIEPRHEIGKNQIGTGNGKQAGNKPPVVLKHLERDKGKSHQDSRFNLDKGHYATAKH